MHTDNRDRQAKIRIGAAFTVIRRPKASLTIIPLLPGSMRDLGTEYLDSDPEGQRALAWRTAGTEAALLLIPAPTGHDSDPVVTTNGSRRWRVKAAGHAVEFEIDEGPNG